MRWWLTTPPSYFQRQRSYHENDTQAFFMQIKLKHYLAHDSQISTSYIGVFALRNEDRASINCHFTGIDAVAMAHYVFKIVEVSKAILIGLIPVSFPGFCDFCLSCLYSYSKFCRRFFIFCSINWDRQIYRRRIHMRRFHVFTFSLWETLRSWLYLGPHASRRSWISSSIHFADFDRTSYS